MVVTVTRLLAAGVKQLHHNKSGIARLDERFLERKKHHRKMCVLIAPQARTKKGGGPADFLIQPSPCTAYNPQTTENALKPGATGFLVYAVSKGLAGRAARDIKHAHPDLDDDDPPVVRLRASRHGSGLSLARSGYEWIYLRAHRQRTGSPRKWVRFRDLTSTAARRRARCCAHVLALKVSPSDAPKRFILSSSRRVERVHLEGGD